MTTARPLIPGLAAIAFYAAYVFHLTRLRRAENILWACHVGCLLVGIGWLARWPLANAIGLLWSLPGVFLWILYLAGGGKLTWPSLLTHVGGAALGLWGAAVFSFPEGAWWKAGIGYVLLVVFSRRVSRAQENVNFSIGVWPGWERHFPSHGRHLVFLLLGAFALFLALEELLRHFLPPAAGIFHALFPPGQDHRL